MEFLAENAIEDIKSAGLLQNSLKSGPNAAIYNMIREIVIEEMHHFNLAANILIALDGYPMIDLC